MPKQKETKTLTKEQAKQLDQCPCCGTCIGPGFMEPDGYQVGDFKICGHCMAILRSRGYIELDGRRPGGAQVCRWLYPDGSIKFMKLIVQPEIRFIPVESPLPEGAMGDKKN